MSPTAKVRHARTDDAAERLEKRADKTDADVHTADTAAERERDLVPGRIRRQRDEARRALARLGVRLGRPGLKPERAAELKAEQERVQGVAARLDRTIADHVKVSGLQWQVEAKLGALNVKGVDNARGTSLSALVKASAKLDDAAAKLSVAECDKRIASYAKGIAQLEAELGPMKAELEQDKAGQAKVLALPKRAGGHRQLRPEVGDADGMGFHAVSGLDLQTVHVKGSAKLDETGTHTLVESLTAAHATVP